MPRKYWIKDFTFTIITIIMFLTMHQCDLNISTSRSQIWHPHCWQNMHVQFTSGQRKAHYGPQARSGPSFVFVKKDLLKHCHIHLFNYCQAAFLLQWQSWVIATEIPRPTHLNISCLALYRHVWWACLGAASEAYYGTLSHAFWEVAVA